MSRPLARGQAVCVYVELSFSVERELPGVHAVFCFCAADGTVAFVESRCDARTLRRQDTLSANVPT